MKKHYFLKEEMNFRMKFFQTDTIDSKHILSSIAFINIIFVGISPTLFNSEVSPGFISKI